MNNNYKSAVKILEASTKTYSDVKQYIDLGICYENIANYKSAEQNYIYASDMIPNILYPKYLLVKLLNKENKINDARVLCRSILEFKVKKKTTADSQIKKEVKTLLESLNSSASSGRIKNK